MKRFAVLALAAVFAFSFTASVAAAPVFGGEFSVETEATIEGESGINFAGSPDATLSLSAAEEGLWSLSVELGSVAPGGVGHDLTVYVGTVGTAADAPALYATQYIENVTVGLTTYDVIVEDADGNYYYGTTTVNLGQVTATTWTKFEDEDVIKAINDKIASDENLKWAAVAAPVSVADHSLNQLELGKYYLNVTPGPFGLAAWGNSYELTDVASAFDFIKSVKKATDPKFRLTTDLAGVGLTVDYDTVEGDKVYAFANAGMIGVAFQDTDFSDSEAGMGVAADVTADLGIASVTAGGAFDLNAAEGNGSLAFGAEATAEVIPGLTVNGGYTSDGRGVAEDLAATEISAGVEYVLDLITVGADFSLASEDPDTKTPAEGDKLNTTTIGGSVAYGEVAEVGVEYMTTNEQGDEDPTLTFTASAEYPVIADVLTVSADFEMINDKQAGHAAADAFTWVDADETEFGADVFTALQASASAAYKLTSAFTVTPGFEYAAYTFDADGKNKATATTLSVDTAYAVSEAAEIALGLSNITTEVEGASLPEADRTVLSAGVTVSF